MLSQCLGIFDVWEVNQGKPEYELNSLEKGRDEYERMSQSRSVHRPLYFNKKPRLNYQRKEWKELFTIVEPLFNEYKRDCL